MIPIVLIALAASPQTEPGSQAKIGAFIRFGSDLYNTRKGQPVSRIVKKIRNHHLENAFDEWHTIYFKDFKVGVLRSGSKPDEQLGSVEISRPVIQLPYGIRLGDPPTKIESIFGAGSKNHRNALMYFLGDFPTGEAVFFRFTNGKLTKIEWVYPID